MPRILIATFGSLGDLHPYLAIAAELRRRSHAVTVATSPVYRDKVEAEGLAFHPVRPDLQPEDRELIAYIMDARHGSERVVRLFASLVKEMYEDSAPAVRQADLVVTHPITFGALLAAEKLRKPWISTVLAPLSFFSVYDPPAIAPAPWLRHLRPLGPRFFRLLWAPGLRMSLGWMRPVLDFRAALGLPPSGNPLFEGQHSPRLVLALFSRHLAAPQPDWPPQTLVTGYPFYDRGDVPPDLEPFLDGGPPPVVFTLGSSAVYTAGDFYGSSLAAVKRLGCRALFLTGGDRQGLPEALPPGVITIAYAPHAAVFSRAAVIVHQGGAGTNAQAMRAGRPCLIVPFAHDQFDNADRVHRQGAAELLYRSRYNARTAETKLRRLLQKPEYARAAKILGEKVRAEDGTKTAADAIENVLTDS